MNSEHISRKFLGWDRPMLELATERLAGELGIADGHLDFSSLLLVLPTGQSGRRFRENMAKFAHRRNACVFPGRIVVPSYFLSGVEDDETVANSAESFLAWVTVLRQVNMSRLSSLFPLETDNRRDLRWHIGVAEKLLELQNRLGEAGLTIEDVAGMNIEEQDRWENLAFLENAFVAKLADFGLQEINRAKKAMTEWTLKGIEKIIIAGVSDPIPLLLQKLGLIASQVPVEIWIHAPENMAGLFDDFGRPLPDYWAKAEVDFPDESLIHLAGGCEAQAETVVNILNNMEHQLRAEDLAVCSANKELYPYIENAFSHHQVSVYNPSGIALTRTSLYHLVNSFSAVINKSDFESLGLLCRNPDFLKHFLDQTGNDDVTRIFKAIDDYSYDHLSAAIPASGTVGNEILKQVIAHVEVLVKAFAEKGFFDFVRYLLSEIYRDARFSPHEKEEDRVFCDAAQHVDRVLGEMNSLPAGGFADKELFDLFIAILCRQVVYPEKKGLSIDIQGWLEMPWEKAGDIIIVGMNEGFLPESIVGDNFLPDALLKQLDLNDNNRRFARDTYIMQSLLKARPNGSVNVIVGKRNITNDPLKPSRLLFKCPDELLVGRSIKLFSEIPEEEEIEAEFTSLWRLAVAGKEEPVKKVSVTGLKDYLTCPFRFYLKHILKMDKVIYESNEMDARDFGSITHAVLEDFGRNKSLADCPDPDEIKKFLRHTMDRHFNEKFGVVRPMPVMVQYESLLQRLDKFAEIQASETAAGWRINKTETSLRSSALTGASGIVISGKIDRIEENINDGRIRILDYKTIDVADPKKMVPQESHVKNSRPDTPEYANFSFGGKSLCWTDLQLPLYALLLGREIDFQSKPIQCGYFNLHKTIGLTGINCWDNMEEYLNDAEQCVLRIIDNLSRNIFWPPAGEVKYDDFDRLCAGYHNLEEAVGEVKGKGGEVRVKKILNGKKDE